MPVSKLIAEATKRERERQFFARLERERLPLPEPEYRFHDTRKWMVDYAWPRYKVALEVEGGVFTQGRHTRGEGFMKDMVKYNSLAVAGWRLVRCTPSELSRPETTTLIRCALTNAIDQWDKLIVKKGGK